MEIYAPLAERIGMHRMKDELEDLAFTELHPEARASILARLDFLRDRGARVVPRILAELDKKLTDGGLGMFQHRFRVYDREGEPCRTPGCTGTVKRIVQNGRSTFYCPTCQK